MCQAHLLPWRPPRCWGRSPSCPTPWWCRPTQDSGPGRDRALSWGKGPERPWEGPHRRVSVCLRDSEQKLLLKKLKGQNPSKATGFDNIPAKFLRDAAEKNTSVITHLINVSITNNHFPNKFKVARVILLYKKGLKSDPGNFRLLG